MTRARKELVHPQTTPYYHCICRCVRRAFLCGTDSFTGKNYEHRKGWVLERLRTLQRAFAIDLFAYAVMSNHYHLVVRLNAGEAEAWTEEEVMERWRRLFSLPLLVERYRRGDSSQAEAVRAKALIETWRERLADLSWFMRSLNEYLARRANAEDGCKGRFYERRPWRSPFGPASLFRFAPGKSVGGSVQVSGTARRRGGADLHELCGSEPGEGPHGGRAGTL